MFFCYLTLKMMEFFLRICWIEETNLEQSFRKCLDTWTDSLRLTAVPHFIVTECKIYFLNGGEGILLILEACTVCGHSLHRHLLTSVIFWYSFQARHSFFTAMCPKQSIFLSKLVRKKSWDMLTCPGGCSLKARWLLANYQVSGNV